MVIIFMIALTIVGLALLHATVLEHKLATREVYKNQAFYLADAGIDHLTYKLYHWEKPNFIESPLGDGRYQVVADYDAIPPYAESTGQRLKDGEVRAEQKIRVNVGEESLFFHAVFADESIKMSGQSSVVGDIGTNSKKDNAITLTPETWVEGNAWVGPNGVPSEVISGEESIGGDKTALTQPRPMEPYPLPPGLISLLDSGPLSVPGGDVQTIEGRVLGGPDVYYYYSEITVNGVLNIDGPCTILVDRLRTQGGGGAGMITIDVAYPDSVIFYVTDEATLAGSGIVNVNEPPPPELPFQDARTLYIYGTASCTSVSFSGSRDLVAAVYAPEADISCTGDAYIYGSLIGYTVDIKGNPKVEYDPKLGEGTVIGYFVLRDWRQVF